MALMATGVLMAPGSHAIAKSLGDTLSAGQIAWARFAFQFLFLLPVVLVGYRGRLPRPSLLQAVRGLLLAVATLCFFWALTYMPLADTAAIFFVEPLLLTLISAAFLGEPIGWRRLLAVVVGFAGALIVIRPSFETVGFPALLPLMAALCFAVYLAMTRRLVRVEKALALQLWVCACSALVLSLALAIGAGTPLGVLQPAWPTSLEWGLLGSLGAISLVAHMLAILGFRLAPASILAPFQYLEILGATILGVIVFGDVPDAPTGFGIAVIVGSGLYVFRRERLAARRETAG
jgi:S-adenosylmethionine uptake transporter